MVTGKPGRRPRGRPKQPKSELRLALDAAKAEAEAKRLAASPSYREAQMKRKQKGIRARQEAKEREERELEKRRAELLEQKRKILEEERKRLENLQTGAVDAEKQRRGDLPHLYGFKWYPWAYEVFACTNKDLFLCAANQISKSSTQIRKCIHWATDTTLWPRLWPVRRPFMFWYLYPTKEVATIEFEKKWVPEFLPRGVMKNDPVYGWKEERKLGYIFAIHFNSGVSVYFKTYAQDVKFLQTGSVDSIFCFTAGHVVETDRGPVPLEAVKIGAKVLTRTGGYERVVDTYSRKAPVIVRYLNDGTRLEGTAEHRVWTLNRGYVAFSELTSEDTLDSVFRWQEKRPTFSMGIHTTDIRNRTTYGTTTLCAGDGKIRERVFCIKRFGRSIVDGFRTITTYITKTGILRTTKFLIWWLCQGLSIPVYISAKRGLRGVWGNITKKLVGFAERLLRLERHKRLQPSTVRIDAGSHSMSKLAHVFIVVRSILFGKMPTRTHVVDSVPCCVKSKTVYNINVQNRHNYYLSGINLANCDEELPEDLYDELNQRRSATDGYFSMVFTATLGQELWRLTMEPKPGEKENFPTAAKWQISMYDCQRYIDGTLSQWTDEYIAIIKARCKSEAEIQRRVYGKFVKDTGLVFPGFERARNVTPYHHVPRTWHVYAAVDVGSGGKNHPGAILFLAVDPLMQRGRVFKGRRYDNEETGAMDLFRYYLEMKKGLTITAAAYDWASKEFGIIASRNGEPFRRADKDHESGEKLLNVLFKNGMLKVYDLDEIMPLATEAETIAIKTPKNQRKDDYMDALRYAAMLVPWDLSIISELANKEPEKAKGYTKAEVDGMTDDERRRIPEDAILEAFAGAVEEEMEEWNELY